MPEKPNIPVTLIADPEEVMRKLSLEMALKPLKKKGGEVEVVPFDPQGINAVIEDFFNISMFCSQKIIVWDGVDKLDKALQERLATSSSKNHLVLVSHLKHKEATTKFAALKAVLVAPQRTVYDDQLPGWVQQRFKERFKGNISFAACKRLIQNTGHQLSIIEKELDALHLFKGTTIEVDDVEALLNRTAESNVFSLVDKVASRATGQALSDLWRELAQGQSAQGIVGILGTHMKRLLDSKRKGNAGGRLSYYEKKLAGQAQHFDLEELEQAVNFLVEADFQLKQTGLNHNVILETLILHLCGQERSLSWQAK